MVSISRLMKRTVPVFAGCLIFSLLLHWRAGTFASDFGRYPDEGMHYINGLLVRDFLTSGQWLHPMSFARAFYAHFPKVSIGQWPPVYDLMQAAWSLVFGESRVSLLWGMQMLTAGLAAVTFRAGELGGAHPVFAAAGAALLIASSLTQYVSSMVMAEAPLAMFSLLAILAWIRFQESSRTRDGAWFGLWTMLAIMTKGDAWLIPIVVVEAIILTRSWRILRQRGFWTAVVLISVVCVPYYLVTLRILTQGWDSQAVQPLSYLAASLRHHLRFTIDAIGIPLSVVALIGMTGRVFVALGKRRLPETFWLVMTLYGATILLFHVMVPTSIEARKIYQIVPVVCLFVSAGLGYGARRLRGGWADRGIQTSIVASTAAIYAFRGFSLLAPFEPGFRPGVQVLLSRPETATEAILISSNPVFDDSEAALIAEWAGRRRHAGTYLVRATKLLSHPVPNSSGGLSFVADASTPDELRARLAAIPIAYTIVHTRPATQSYPHHELLRTTLLAHPEEWDLIYSSRKQALGQENEIEIFRYRKSVSGAPIHYDIDLSRKINETIEINRP